MPATCILDTLVETSAVPDLTPDVQRQLDANHHITLISLVILYYDYLLTLPLEISRFWGWKEVGGWASGLFYLNRYASVLGHVPVAMQFLWTGYFTNKAEICEKLQSYHQYYAIAMQLIVGALLIMRTYALYDRNRWILGLLLGIAIAAGAFGTWAVLSSKSGTSEPVPVPRVGCLQSLTDDEGTHFAAAWSGVLLFDITIFLLTLYKSIVLRRRGGRTLLNVLLRDGAMYFGVLVCANLTNIISFLLGEPYTKGLCTTFTNVLSSTMISRLMLNLRDPKLTLPRQPRSSRRRKTMRSMFSYSSSSSGQNTRSGGVLGESRGPEGVWMSTVLEDDGSGQIELEERMQREGRIQWLESG